MRLLNSLSKMSLILISGKLLALLQISILSRVLEVREFGDFSSYLSWINIISIPLIAGLQPYIIRNVTRGNHQGKFNRSIVNWSMNYVLMMFFLSSAVSIVVLHYFQKTPVIIITFIVFTVLLKGLINRYSSLLYGFGYPLDSSFPLVVVQPLIFSICLATSDYLYNITLIIALVFTLGSQVIVLLIYKWLIRKLSFVYTNYNENNNLEEFLIHSKKMMPLTILFVVTTFQNELGVFYLSFNSAREELAYFKIAFSLAILSTFMVQVVNSFIADKVVLLLKNNRYELERLLSITILLSFGFGLCVYVIFVFFGDFIISILFGEKYEDSYNYLLILGAGFLSTTTIGSSALVLNLSGNEKLTLIAFLISVLVSALSCFFLYFSYGGIGVSIAISLGLVSSTLTMFAAIRYKMGLYFTFKILSK